jgi:probable HAF family extracellular repeat protein
MSIKTLSYALVFLGFCCAHAGQYTLTDLGSLGGDVSVRAINNTGQITGIANTANGTSTAFLYTGGKMTDLGTVAGGNFSYGTAINSAGVVAGIAGTSTVGGIVHAVIFSNGHVTDLGTLGGTNSAANGINDSAQVVGYGEIRGDNHYRHAFLYMSSTGMQDIGTLGGPESIARGINDSGAVVGYSVIAVISPPRAFLYSNNTMIDLGNLPVGANVIPISVATAINVNGQITGYSSAGGRGDLHAFFYSLGTGMIDLGTLGGSESIGNAINASGQIVGKSDTTGAGQHGFLFTPGGPGLIDLNTLVAGSPSATYVTLVQGYGINDDGLIVTDGVDSRNGHTHAYLLTSVSALLASLKAEVVGVGPGTSLVSMASVAQTHYSVNDIHVTCAVLTIQPDLAAKFISDDATIQAALSCPY